MNGQFQKELAWWVVWAAFLIGVIQVYFLLGRGAAPATEKSSDVALLGIVPFVVSGVIRWVMLPKLTQSQPALVLFIVGLAMAEASCFLGLFVFPKYKFALFILSILGIAQFLPTFASRFQK